MLCFSIRAQERPLWQHGRCNILDDRRHGLRNISRNENENQSSLTGSRQSAYRQSLVRLEGLAFNMRLVVRLFIAWLALAMASGARFPGEADRVLSLPGAVLPTGFGIYSGYLPVNATSGKYLFYMLVEAPNSTSTPLPLVRFLNGGPGCSSIGGGCMEETGPLRPDENGQLVANPQSWNQFANSETLARLPALACNRRCSVVYRVARGRGVLFFQNAFRLQCVCVSVVAQLVRRAHRAFAASSDDSTASDNYQAMLRFLDKFPQFVNRDFYLAGESYAVRLPQCARVLLC